MIRAIGGALVVLAVSCHGPSAPAAVEDTPANRRAQIERYLQVMPPEDLMKDMAEKLAAQIPAEKRDRFLDLMTKQFDLAKFRSIMVDSMVKHFTADELSGMADFYGSPRGKSAMKKFGAYMADIMPAIQAEVIAAFQKAQREI